uniref:Uncharacterized protein n=1 Tax=Anopheles epiroticus TaxID=199890 RepID=A0A182P3Z8_9DIPT
MADDGVQQSCASPVPGIAKQLAGTMYNETVQNIRELMYKDKSVVMVKAVELLVLNQHQQQEMFLLKQTMHEALGQTEQMRKDVYDQPVIESFMSNIDAQNSSTRKQLQEKLDSITVHITRNEGLRKKLKKELAGFQFIIDELRKNVQEKEETAKGLQHTLEEVATRADQISKQRSAVAAEMAKLREDCQVKMAELCKIATSCEDSIKKTQSDIAEKDRELVHYSDEMEMVKQSIAAKLQACSKIQTEKAALQQRCADLNQHYAAEVGSLERSFMQSKDEIDQMFDQANSTVQRRVTELEHVIASMKEQIMQKERYERELNENIMKLDQELEGVHNRKQQLENELASFKADEAEGNQAGKKPPKSSKPTTLTSGRPKAYVFTKKANHDVMGLQPSTSDTD